MKIVMVEWEDIVGVVREPLPKYQDDLLEHQLLMQTTGLLIEFTKYLVVVTDYDVTHHGAGWCHNDYTIIPRGVVRWVHELVEYTGPQPVKEK